MGLGAGSPPENEPATPSGWCQPRPSTGQATIWRRLRDSDRDPVLSLGTSVSSLICV